MYVFKATCPWHSVTAAQAEIISNGVSESKVLPFVVSTWDNTGQGLNPDDWVFSMPVYCKDSEHGLGLQEELLIQQQTGLLLRI